MLKKKVFKLISLCMVCVFLLTVPAYAGVVNKDYFDTVNVESKLLPEDVTSSKATAPWGLRGDYISLGTVMISDEGNGVIGIYGSTDASVTCDKIRVKIYLDVYKNGKWSIVKSWEFSDTNNYGIDAYFETSDYAMGSYYRLRGAHSVTKGSKVENLSTVTDGILID